MTTPNLPKHIAIMLDGNRRWAVERGLPKFVGHTEGMANVKNIALAAVERGIPYLTLWGLSTENLKREEVELKHLFSLFEKFSEHIELLQKHNVQFRHVGNLALLPDFLQKAILDLVEKTKNNTGMVLTMALAYGGKDDVVRAVRKIVEEGTSAEQITEETIANHVDTVGIPDVDLVIRTGGAQRFSNFLLWQSTYAELYFTPVFWPAFDEVELDKAIEWYSKQERRMGK